MYVLGLMCAPHEHKYCVCLLLVVETHSFWSDNECQISWNLTHFVLSCDLSAFVCIPDGISNGFDWFNWNSTFWFLAYSIRPFFYYSLKSFKLKFKNTTHLLFIMLRQTAINNQIDRFTFDNNKKSCMLCLPLGTKFWL